MWMTRGGCDCRPRSCWSCLCGPGYRGASLVASLRGPHWHPRSRHAGITRAVAQPRHTWCPCVTKCRFLSSTPAHYRTRRPAVLSGLVLCGSRPQSQPTGSGAWAVWRGGVHTPGLFDFILHDLTSPLPPTIPTRNSCALGRAHALIVTRGLGSLFLAGVIGLACRPLP